MVESVRHPAIQTFLEWAREAIGRDPSFRVKVDAALAELALLFHSHWIGQVIVHPGGDTDAWLTLLLGS